jgi:signal transduction histidine kinase
MSTDDQLGEDEQQKTARTVGQLVKYSREVNQSETVEEVGTYALEATYHVIEGQPEPTIVEVNQGDARVLESMASGIETGGDATGLERRACETGNTIVLCGGDSQVQYSTEQTELVDTDAIDIECQSDTVSIATSSVYDDETGGMGGVVSARWSALDSVREYHVKPLEYMADHVATAINNIRSREQLERARNDLETRKEMIEMYDSLLRHDLGNDLQVITGYSDALVSSIEDDTKTEYAETIERTAKSAADLIDRVGNLVKTLEKEEEPEVTDLEPTLSSVVYDVNTKYESLAVEYEPGAFEYQVFAGDLLDSIFTNILSNAAVHNDDPVTVRVYAAEPTLDTVVVGFADDGTGVHDEVADEIFEMGKKGPDSNGTGFGLGFVRALTESYGGGVDVSESDRGGADFRVRLERA